MGERGAERSGNGEIGGARARGKRRAGGGKEGRWTRLRQVKSNGRLKRVTG